MIAAASEVYKQDGCKSERTTDSGSESGVTAIYKYGPSGLYCQPPRAIDLCVCSLFEVLGHGKDSTVYKGRKKQTICYCAIKRVPKSAKARVLQEVGS